MDSSEDLSNQIENRLFHIRPNVEVNPCILEVQVKNIGSWIIKIRKNNVIVNDSNLIFDDCIKVDATIIFRTPETFWTIANAPPVAADSESSSNYIFTGDENCISSLFLLLSLHNTKKSESKKRKSVKEKVYEGTKSFKSGWLHKKRDIIAGWRHRYFKVYMGRVEYYIDNNGVVPRGVIPLLGADIIGPMRCTINGNDDHWCLTVDPRHRDKSFKLASERSGVEGNTDIESWIKALTAASRSSENHTGMLTNPSAVPSSPPRPAMAASMASIPRRLAAAATSLARSSSRDILSGKTDGESSEGGGSGGHCEAVGHSAERGKSTEGGERSALGDAELRKDVAAVVCLAAVVGANLSSGQLLSGPYWLGMLAFVSVLLVVKILYDFYRYML